MSICAPSWLYINNFEIYCYTYTLWSCLGKSGRSMWKARCCFAALKCFPAVMSYQVVTTEQCTTVMFIFCYITVYYVCPGSPPPPPLISPLPPSSRRHYKLENHDKGWELSITDCTISLMTVCGRGSWLMFCGRTIFFSRALQHSWRVRGTKRELKKKSAVNNKLISW